MKLEDQVLTIEQSKHLQELGLDMSDAALYWDHLNPFGGDDGEQVVWQMTEGIRDILKGKEKIAVTGAIPTYTLQEVLDKLPKQIRVIEYAKLKDVYWLNFGDNVKTIEYHSETFLHKAQGETLFEVAYNMLCWVVDNGYLEESK